MSKRNILFILAMLVNIIWLCFYVADIGGDKRAAFFIVSMFLSIAGVLVSDEEESK